MTQRVGAADDRGKLVVGALYRLRGMSSLYVGAASSWRPVSLLECGEMFLVVEEYNPSEPDGYAGSVPVGYKILTKTGIHRLVFQFYAPEFFEKLT